jgi:hypothetical protein
VDLEQIHCRIWLFDEITQITGWTTTLPTARDGQVSTAYLKDHQAWLLTDVDADAPPESIPRLLSELEQRGSSPLNVTAAAETLGYPNRPTLDRHDTPYRDEVDLCPVDATTSAGSERTVPIDSKWVDTGWRGEGCVIAGKYNAGVLPTASLERYGVKRNVLCILGVGEQ